MSTFHQYNMLCNHISSFATVYPNKKWLLNLKISVQVGTSSLKGQWRDESEGWFSSTEYIFYCKRAILFLSSSKILTPHPPLRPASVYPRLCCWGRTDSPGGEGDGGSIFWKTREIRLPSYSKICTLCSPLSGGILNSAVKCRTLPLPFLSKFARGIPNTLPSSSNSKAHPPPLQIHSSAFLTARTVSPLHPLSSPFQVTPLHKILLAYSETTF